MPAPTPKKSCWFQHTAARRRLGRPLSSAHILVEFQHTAARRRLDAFVAEAGADFAVSTHSRPKAAGEPGELPAGLTIVSTHSRPKAAGQYVAVNDNRTRVSTHSRPKAAGVGRQWVAFGYDSFNTQPPEGGWGMAS